MTRLQGTADERGNGTVTEIVARGGSMHAAMQQALTVLRSACSASLVLMLPWNHLCAETKVEVR